jgi:ubiquinone/menaquinone biosynthesis C-methylase UbiE
MESILEIGPGSKLVSRELQSMGYTVTTCDFDVHVNPDVVSDVRSLPFEENSFDCIMACQILEHIPFEDFKKVIENFSKISKKYVIISLPNRSTMFEFVIKFPFIQTLFKKNFFDYTFQIPVKFPGFAESDQHYWEIDQITTKRSQVRKVLSEYFIITKEFQPPLNKYHRFFILEKK